MADGGKGANPSGAEGKSRLDLGLRRRMRNQQRRLSSQHRQLDGLYAFVLEALESGAVHSARERWFRFVDALESHLSLEERFYFPALHGMRRELGPKLADLVDEHADLREDIRAITALLTACERESSADFLKRFAARLADHEQREEELVARIIRDSEGPDSVHA